MSNATLFEIRDDLAAIADLFFELGGDVSDEATDAALTEWLTEAEGARDEKLDAYAALIREIDARGVARAQESDRLAKLAQADAATVKRLKDRLLWFFEDQGLTRVQTERFRISKSANGGAVPVVLRVPPEHLPPMFQRVKVSADVDLLRRCLENEDDRYLATEYADFGTRGSHVRIA